MQDMQLVLWVANDGGKIFVGEFSTAQPVVLLAYGVIEESVFTAQTAIERGEQPVHLVVLAHLAVAARAFRGSTP